MEITAHGLVRNIPLVKTIPSIIAELGYDPNFVNPTPIGQGAEHVVYLYAAPAEPRKVLKVPKKSPLSFKQNLEVEEIDRVFVERYLPKFAVPSRVLQKEGNYLIEAQFITGRALILQEINSYRDQVEDMIECNARMVREVGASLDFFGFDGVKDLFTLAGLRGKPMRLANVLVAADNRLRLIDNSLQHIALFGTTFERARGRVLYGSSRMVLWTAGLH